MAAQARRPDRRGAVRDCRRRATSIHCSRNGGTMSAIMNAPSDLKTTARRRMTIAVVLGAFAAITFAPGEARAQKADGKESSRTPYQAYLAADCLTGSNF